MDEKRKEQILPALIVFCWTVLGWILIGAGIGLLTGRITPGVTMVRK